MFKREAVEEMEVSEYEAPAAYAVSADSCGSHFHTRFDFEEAGEETNVRMSLHCRPVTFMAKLMSPIGKLMAGPMRKCMEADLQDLKQALESGKVNA